MSDREVLLKDTFEFEDWEFLVRVKKTVVFVHGKIGEIREVDYHGDPSGMGRTPRHWVLCEAKVAKLRPDYPFSVSEPWPENVDKHYQFVDLLEKPSKGLVFYGTEWVGSDTDEQEMAQDVIEEMKEQYRENQPARLEVDV